MALLTPPTRGRRAGWVALAVALLWAAATAADQPVATENEIKAGFLYNFALFVEWPATVASPARDTFIIGVIGEDLFGRELEKDMQRETVNGRPLVIRHFVRVEDLEFCHILFIRASETGHLGAILEAARHWSTLTVGETASFLAAGGMINFMMKGNRVRFAVNVTPAERAGLRISSKLLNLAEVVQHVPLATER